jgi:DNA-binding CsgD family transcriptional regulator
MLDVTARRPRVSRLTTREREVLAGLALGLYRKEIAAGLGVSIWTVNDHVHSARRRLGASTSVHAMVLAGGQLAHARGRWRAYLRATTGETPYRDELAAQVGGVVELLMPFGRADVATQTDVFEVEPADRWSTGLQQAAAYGVLSGRRPNLAIYAETIIPVEKAVRIFEAMADLPTPIGLWIRGPNGWTTVERRPRSAWEPGGLPRMRML